MTDTHDPIFVLSHTLCSNCKEAFQIWEKKINDPVHHPGEGAAISYKEEVIKREAQGGCGMCKLFNFAISPQWTSLTYLDNFYVVFDKYHGRIDGTPYMLNEAGSVVRIDPISVPWSNVRTWLSSCLQEEFHGHDAQPPVPRYLHTWLIDVEDRCLKKMTAQSEYAALSYVWGGASQPLHLQGNTAALQKPGAFDDSTACAQTIGDALQICRNTDTRYIWVRNVTVSKYHEINADGLLLG